MVMPIPFMEVESAWARVAALQAPDGMSDDEFFTAMRKTTMLDMTLPFSVQTPQWANYVPLSVNYTVITSYSIHYTKLYDSELSKAKLPLRYLSALSQPHLCLNSWT